MHTQYHHKRKTYTPQLRNEEARNHFCLKCGVTIKGWDSVHHVKVCAAVKAAQHQMTRNCATLFSTPVAATANEFFEMELDEGIAG